MATIRKEVLVHARLETAWDAVRDFGALHTRLVPGFVTDVKLEEGARVVTFGNGTVARELLVAVDEREHRLVWSVVGHPKLTHHNGVAQVFAAGPDRCLFVWTADFLPGDVAPTFGAMMEQAMPIVRETLERAEANERVRR